MTDRAAIVEKIKKLVALAKDQDGKPEGDLAAEIVDRLMREHAIEDGELVDPGPILWRSIAVGPSWTSALIVVVAKHCACRAARAGSTSMAIFGRAADLDVCEYLLDVCLRELGRAGSKTGQAGTGWYFSAVKGLSDKFEAIRTTQQALDATGTALVRRRDADVVAWMAQHVPTTTRFIGASYSRDGYETGWDLPLHDGIKQER